MDCVLPKIVAPQRTQRLVWNILKDVPGLAHLCDTPALMVAVSLSTRRFDNCKQWKYLHRLAKQKEEKLAEELGLPKMKILRRLTADALTESSLQILKELKENRLAMRMMSHAPLVSSSFLYALQQCVQSPDPMLRKQFVSELGELPNCYRPSTEDLRLLHDFLIDFDGSRRIHSVGQYRRLHSELWGVLDRFDSLKKSDPQLPPAPIPEEKGDVEAIGNWRGLVKESLAMKNCSGSNSSLLNTVVEGSGYFYRVLQSSGMPRTTLYIIKDSRNIWRIGQARRKFNKSLNSTQLHRLAVWLADRQSLTDATLCLAADTN